jgi:hypothetical protein
MDFNRNTVELKSVSYQCVFDKRTAMSGRVASAIIYTVIRAGEVIDWWFPVKAADPMKTQ